MPRDPLAWLPLLQYWTRCLGEGGEAIACLGDLGALPDLDMAALLPGGPGWADVQRTCGTTPRGRFGCSITAWRCGGWRRCRRRSGWCPQTALNHPRSRC